MSKLNICCSDSCAMSREELRNAINLLFDDITYCTHEEAEFHIVLKLEGFKSAWGRVDEQSFKIATKGTTVCISAQSPMAVFWGVCELKERWGVLHTLSGDVYPEKKQIFYLPQINEVFTPRQEIREWRILCDFLTGGEGRSLSEQKQLLRQLAKLKNNSIKCDLWTFPPFLSYSCINPVTEEMIEKKGGFLHCCQKFPVKKGSISARYTEVTERYTNPDFRDCKTDEELTAVAQAYVAEIIKTAKEYDMRVVMMFMPFDYPAQFAPMLDQPKQVRQLGDKMVCEGGDVCGEKSLFMVNLIFDTVLEKYPESDVFCVSFPEISRSSNSFENAIAYLDECFGISEKYDLKKILAYKDEMLVTPGETSRSEIEGKMNLELIAALYKSLELSGIDKKIFKLGKTISMCCCATTPHLLPLYKELLKDGYELYGQMYTCDHNSRTLHTYDYADFSRKSIMHVLTLQDDNVGSIVQSQMQGFSRVFDFNIRHGVRGFSTRFWPQGDLDEMACAISTASWKDVRVSDAIIEWYLRIYGNAADAVKDAMEEVEKLTSVLCVTDIGATFPTNKHVSDLIGTKYLSVSNGIKHAIVGFLEAKAIMENALGVEGLTLYAKKRLRYFIGRFEFSEKILQTMHQITLGNKKLAAEDIKGAKDEYRKAMEMAKRGLKALGEVAYNDNDIANIAIYEAICIHEVADRLELMQLL